MNLHNFKVYLQVNKQIGELMPSEKEKEVEKEEARQDSKEPVITVESQGIAGHSAKTS